jgi:hypothetical protein
MHESFIIASWMTDITLAILIESGLDRSEIRRGSNGNFLSQEKCAASEQLGLPRTPARNT